MGKEVFAVGNSFTSTFTDSIGMKKIIICTKGGDREPILNFIIKHEDGFNLNVTFTLTTLAVMNEIAYAVLEHNKHICVGYDFDW